MDKWILASEMIPDDDSRVLIYVEYPVYGKEVYFKRGFTGGKYRHSSNKWECDAFIGRRVIAWTPFPEPPKGV